MQAAARKLQREANSLARRLEAVMHDKLKDRTSFDATTPIDKTLEYLQNAIMVSSRPVCLCLSVCVVGGGRGFVVTRQLLWQACTQELQTRPFQEKQQPSFDSLLRA